LTIKYDDTSSLTIPIHWPENSYPGQGILLYGDFIGFDEIDEIFYGISCFLINNTNTEKYQDEWDFLISYLHEAGKIVE